MRRLRGVARSSAVLACLALAPTADVAGQSRAGGWAEERVVTLPGAVLDNPETGPDDQGRARSLAVSGHDRALFRVYRVASAAGRRLWLVAEKGSAAGWVDAAWVMPLDRATDYYTDRIRDDPGGSANYNRRGWVWKERGEFDRAIADYGEAIRLDPKDAVAYRNRGVARAARREYDRAIADFDTAIRLDPRFALPYNNRGLARHDKRDFDGAIADFDAAIRLDPKFAIAYGNRGNARRARREFDRAIADYGEAIRLDPKDALAYSNRGVAWRAKGEYDRAIADFGRAIRLDPRSAWPYYARSVSAMLAGRDGVADARAAIARGGWRGDLPIYAALIGHVEARRAKHGDAAVRLLDDAARSCDRALWPYPIVRFLRREIGEGALLAAADDDARRTEARCFLGLDRLLDGHPGPAVEHFRWVEEHGVANNTEYTIALAELDRTRAVTTGGPSRPD